MKQSDILIYTKKGFDAQKYFTLQKQNILDRIAKFPGRLYLEIGGKFMFDSHATRVLPGFDPETKRKIFQDLAPMAEVLFCMGYDDIQNNRQLSNEDIGYIDYVLDMLKQIETNIGIKPKIVINKFPVNLNDEEHSKFKTLPTDRQVQNSKFEQSGYKVYKRYAIQGYPNDTKIILSDKGFGRDDYIDLQKNLILVTGAASNSGKMSTCLGQIYLDHQNGLQSGYAKYETFPIWNIELNHPVNLAYEAATADIGDYNELDPYHQKAYGINSVNYNRDVEAFEIVMNVAKEFLPENNFMRSYRSPTDMGISQAGFAITDDEVVSIASLQEISRRKTWYQEIVERGEGKPEWLTKCDELTAKCMKYINEKGYNPNLEIQ